MTEVIPPPSESSCPPCHHHDPHAPTPPSPLSETANSQLPSTPGTGLIWAHFAALTKDAFTESIVTRLHSFIQHTPQYHHTHINMLGPIVVRYVSLMLDELSDEQQQKQQHFTPSSKEQDPCRHCKRSFNQQQQSLPDHSRRPRSLRVPPTSSLTPMRPKSLHVDDIDLRTSSHHHDIDAPPPRRPSFRDLAYQAVRLNKILPESFSAHPHPNVPAKIVRKLSITTPTPDLSCPVSPELSMSHDFSNSSSSSTLQLPPSQYDSSLQRSYSLHASDPQQHHDNENIINDSNHCNNNNNSNNNNNNKSTATCQIPQTKRQSHPHLQKKMFISDDNNDNDLNVNTNIHNNSNYSHATVDDWPDVPSSHDISSTSHSSSMCRQSSSSYNNLLKHKSSEQSSSFRSTDVELDGFLDQEEEEYENDITCSDRGEAGSCLHLSEHMSSSRWRSQSGKPDPASKLPRAGCDATLISQSAQKVSRPRSSSKRNWHGVSGLSISYDNRSNRNVHHSTQQQQQQQQQQHNRHQIGNDSVVDDLASVSSKPSHSSRLVLLRKQRERRRNNHKISTSNLR